MTCFCDETLLISAFPVNTTIGILTHRMPLSDQKIQNYVQKHLMSMPGRSTPIPELCSPTRSLSMVMINLGNVISRKLLQID